MFFYMAHGLGRPSPPMQGRAGGGVNNSRLKNKIKKLINY
jgi:hypothetical protein